MAQITSPATEATVPLISKHTRGTHGSPGFTLIELLVVISIIGLLVAILLPALNSARTAAHKAVSLSNARQISIALHTYAADNKQSMPFMRQKFINSAGMSDYRWAVQWGRMLYEQSYVQDMEVYWSPARITFEGDYPHSSRTGCCQYAHTFESTGYGLNPGVYGSSESDHLLNGAPLPLRLEESGAPPASEMLMLVESGSTHGSIGGLNGYFIAYPDKHTDTSRVRLFSYNNTVVRSYVDGSVMAAGPRNGRILSGNGWALDNFDTLTPVHRTDIGWDPQKSTPRAEYSGSQLGGNWTFGSHNGGWYHKPWFTRWRSEWYPGFR